MVEGESDVMMRALIEYALANAVMATAMAAVVYGVTRVVRRPAVRNALWILVLVRLLLPPVWGVPLPVDSPVSKPPAVEPLEVPVASPPRPEVGTPLTDDELALALAYLETAPEPVAVEPTPAAETPAKTAEPVNPWRWAYLAAGLVWLAGTCWIAGRAIRLTRRFQRQLADATPAPADVQRTAAELAAAMGLGRCPEVLFVPGRLWPSLWAPAPWRAAKLLIPAALWPLLAADHRRAVLAHELAHARRGDPWVRWLELVAVAVYWWHPLLRWARRQLRQSEEECCDMWVVAALAGRRAYATALVETAAFLSGPEPAFSSALASGAGPVDDLQRRVTMIMRATWPARMTRIGLAAVLGLGTVGLAVGPTLGSAEAQEGRPAPKKEGDRPREGDRKEGDRPKDGDRKEGDRPRDGDRKERGPKDGDRKEADRPKDGDRKDRPRDGDRKEDGPSPREKVNEADVKAAREEAEEARANFRKAMERMRAAEEKLAKAEGRPFNGGGFPGGVGGAGGGAGGFPGRPGAGVPGRGDPRPEGTGVRGPKDGDRPEGRPEGAGPRGPMPGGDDLQRQVQELRKAIEELRRAMQEQRGGGDRK